MLLARSVVLAMVVLALVVAPASAAAPVATDDTLDAAPTAALDVLANDSDPDGDALTVSVSTQPAHGTVTCSALGACFYSAASGFTGPDSFTYTARDAAGETDAGTVNVTVSASTATQAIAALDDDVATLAGQAIDFNILSNDRGAAPLGVQSSTAASHGTATCTANGTCHYEPAASFAGRDGFTYVLRDNSGLTRTAAVHIAVAPAGSTFGLSAGGAALNPEAGGIVGPGGLAAWFASASPEPAGLASDELRALPLPAITSAIGGPHSLVGGSTSTARAWDSAGAGAGTATDGALLGGAVSQLFPRPLPPISQGTGGDGHVPILLGTKVFAFFHHQFPTEATCVDRATGTTCPGYPKQLNVGASDINGPGVVSGSKIWWHAMLSGDSNFSQSASIGLYCWDADTDSSCGMTIVERVPATAEQPASHPVLAGGKMWFGANTGKLYCLEPATGAPCATPSLNTGLTGGAGCMFTPSGLPCMDLITHGSRVFVSLSGDEVACLDVIALTTCPGWSSPKAFNGNWNIVNKYNASGSPVGICVVHLQGVDGQCVDDATPDTITTINNWVDTDGFHYAATQEAETGTRTMVVQLARGGIGCYDWTTMARCTGGGYDAGGWLDRDKDGNSLPSGYGAVFDGACAIALGDPGRVYTADPAGTSPCTSLRSGSGTRAIDLRAQRCDGTVGAARWKSVVLTDSDGTELDNLAVTVRDAETGAVLLTGDLITGGTLDISSINPAEHPSIVVDANASAKNATVPWDDGIPPRIVVSWTPDPQHVCVQTRATDVCSAAGTSALAFNAHLANPARDASAGLTLRRTACPLPAAAQGAAPSAAKKPGCKGRRRFRIHVVYRGKNVRRISVTANGKRQKLVRLRPRPVFQIDLRTRPRQRVVVRIRVVNKKGKTIRGKRIYHPCSKKRKGRKHFKL